MKKTKLGMEILLAVVSVSLGITLVNVFPDFYYHPYGVEDPVVEAVEAPALPSLKEEDFAPSVNALLAELDSEIPRHTALRGGAEVAEAFHARGLRGQLRKGATDVRNHVLSLKGLLEEARSRLELKQFHHQVMELLPL